jgi:hypothetical protein
MTPSRTPMFALTSLLSLVSLAWGAAACSSAGGATSEGTGGAGGGAPGTGGASSATATSSTGTSSTSSGTTCNGTTESTAGVACSLAFDEYNGSASVKSNSTVTWSCTGTTRDMTSNGIPDHEVGTFPNPNCPNTIKPYAASASVTLTPVNKGTATKVGIVGYALNGVKFDPSTAGTCTVNGGSATCSLIGNTGAWNIEALGQSSFNFGVDDSNAHVQPTGEYHYHGMPEAVLDKLGKGEEKPTLVGFALDGFPVYARYGFTDAMDASSPVKIMKGSYQLAAAPDAGRPSTSTYPMGAFTQDYEYVAGSGDLDECNGRMGVTPEFPCGIYHYYITDTYPFITRCEKGTPKGGGMMMGGSGSSGSGGMGPPPCMPGQTSMCCGDNTCDGPETADNCPADCP